MNRGLKTTTPPPTTTTKKQIISFQDKRQPRHHQAPIFWVTIYQFLSLFSFTESQQVGFAQHPPPKNKKSHVDSLFLLDPTLFLQ